MLNLPSFDFKIKTINGRDKIFDFIRKKYVALTPEEWVRQHLLRMFVEFYNVPAGLIGVEKSLKIGTLTLRADIVIYNKIGTPLVVVEVKTATTALNQNVLDQASVYNKTLKVKYVILSNGLEHIILKFNEEINGYVRINKMPTYSELTN